jgi:hypothetical protein
MQSNASSKGDRWTRHDAERAMVAQATATIGRSRVERATTVLRASIDTGEVGFRAPQTHVEADDRFVRYEAKHPRRMIHWEHARWRYGVAPYQGRDMQRALTIKAIRVKVAQAQQAELVAALDTGALNMVVEATQASRENAMKASKYKALFTAHASKAVTKPDGHSKWCGCHRCTVVKRQATQAS